VETSYMYDDLKRVTAETTGGVTTLYQYNANGNVTRTTRQGADGTNVLINASQFNTAGVLVSSSNALGLTVYSSTVAANGHTVKTTVFPDGGTRVEEYYQDGTLYSVTGSAVHPVKYEYPVFGTKEIKLDAQGNPREWTCTWTNMAGQTVSVDRPFGSGTASTVYIYRPGTGQLDRVIDPDGITTFYDYNPQTGEQTTVAILASGSSGQINLSGSDRVTVTTTSYPGGGMRRTTTQVCNQAGALATAFMTTTDGYGSNTTTTQFGQTTQTATEIDSDAGTHTITTTYPDQSTSVQSYTGNNLTSQARKDANGQQINRQDYQYDAHGRQWKVTDARNGTTTYAYYPNSDLLQSVITPAPGDGSPAQTTSYEYDSMGRKTADHLPDAGTVQYQYDNAGDLVSQSGARTYAVTYTYDSQGRKTTMTTANGAITTWKYDQYTGLLSSKLYTGGSGPSYTYTPGGRLASRTSARGTSATYGYTFAGDLASIVYSDGTPAVTLNYDRQGRLQHVTDSTGGRTLLNTDDGQVSAEIFENGSIFAGGSVSRLFDGYLRNNSLTVTPPGGSPIVQTIGYDAASRYSTFVEGGITAAYSYAPNSSLVSGITLQNNGNTLMTTAKNYDNLNRLQSIVQSVASHVVSSCAYVYNNANQRVRATYADGSYWVYGYDNLGQVTSGNRHWSDGLPVDGQQFGYTFDGIGNRTNTMTNGRSCDYAPNALNQYDHRVVSGTLDVIGSAAPAATVTVNATPTKRHGAYFAGTITADNSNAPVNQSVTITGVKPRAGTSGTAVADVVTTSTGAMYIARTPEKFTYDLDGNLTSDGRWTYTWDAENRLIQMDTIASATNCVSAQRLQFTYDWQGRRVQKVLLQATGTSGYQSVAITRFLYDGWNLIAELDGNNSLIRSYCWGLDLSGSPQGAGGVGGLLSLTTTGSNAGSYFPTYDGNGNIVGLLDTFGTLASIYEYSPFGEPVRVSGAMAGQNPFRFSTKYEGESGQLDFGHRWYDPPTGRWLSPDPLGDESFYEQYVGPLDDDATEKVDEESRKPEYLLVGNNPLNYYDLLGTIGGSGNVRLDDDGTGSAHNDPPGERKTITSCQINKVSLNADSDVYFVAPLGTKVCPCAKATATANGHTVIGIIGDFGPSGNGWGEISLAAATALSIPWTDKPVPVHHKKTKKSKATTTYKNIGPYINLKSPKDIIPITVTVTQ